MSTATDRKASRRSTGTSTGAAALSAARAYLHPIMGKRKNLRVRTSTLVTRIHLEGRRAVGVEIERHGGGTETIEAGEVILAGGAINTPQLLLLSGIGPAAELEALGIPVVADRPGVGRHLQDHLEVYIQHQASQPVSEQPSATQRWRRPFIGAQWLFLRSGPGATNHFEGGGFVRSNDAVAYPNLMFHFLPLAIRYDGSAGAKGHGYQVHVGPMYSDARGSLTLTSTDPHDHPALRFNYLSTDQDRPRMGRGHPRRAGHPRPAGDGRRTTPARPHPDRPSRPTRRSSTGSGAMPRPPCTHRARPG